MKRQHHKQKETSEKISELQQVENVSSKTDERRV